jgi:cell division septal protein FtsQ
VKKNRRRGARLGIAVLRGTVRGLLAIVALGAAAVAAERALAWVKAHPYFALREIDVAAGGRVDPKTLVAWAGLAPGMSIWSVHATEAEGRLLAHPRIREASLERTLPNRVRVHVEERRPVAILLANRPLLVAGDGAVFPALDGEAVDGLPYVTGVSAMERASSDGGNRLRAAARLVALWQAHAQWPAISEIRLDGEELVVFAAGTPLAVRFATEAKAEDFARLSAVLELWRGREARVAAIDLSLPGQAVLKLQRRSKATPAHLAPARAAGPPFGRQRSHPNGGRDARILRAGLSSTGRSSRVLGKTVI